MEVREPARAVVVASLLFAAYSVAVCPCGVLAQCTQGKVYALTLGPAALVAFLNANQIR